MKSVDDMYKGSFFSRRHKLSWRVPYVCNAICKTIKFNSVIDVGCGIGDYVKGFGERGKISTGIEGSENCLPYLVMGSHQNKIWIVDIRKCVHIPWCDLVVCLEVLEHIEEKYVTELVRNLASLSNKILTSAAPPGQGGHYHVNCQPKSYWIEKFVNHGYEYNEEIVDRVRKEWEPVRCKKEMSAYYNNLMYFERLPGKESQLSCSICGWLGGIRDTIANIDNLGLRGCPACGGLVDLE